MYRNQGFTLVELAIVMIVIGLLIGGILKGQEIAENASIKQTIKQTDEIRSALYTFRDIHQGLMPGDMPNARTRLQNCNDATNCRNGNGNYQIGIDVPNWSHDDQSGLLTEPTQFWKHLTLADLLAGVNPYANRIAWQESHPPIAIGGGMHIFYSSQSSEGEVMSGHNLYLRPVVRGDAHANSGSIFGTSTMTPGEAYKIDVKIDDGNGQKGTVRVDDNHQRCTDTRGIYRGTNFNSATCLMAINVHK